MTNRVFIVLVLFLSAVFAYFWIDYTTNQKTESKKSIKEITYQLREKYKDHERAGVAIVSVFDELSIMHIDSLLYHNGIPVFLEDGWGISHVFYVPDERVDEAKQLIIESSREVPNSIVVSISDRLLDVTSNKYNVCLWISDKSCDEVIKDANQEYYNIISTIFNRESVKEKTPVFKYIKEMKLIERNYLDENGLIAKGYDVRLMLTIDLSKRIADLIFDGYTQVWDNSKKAGYFFYTPKWYGTKEEIKENKKKYGLTKD